MEGLEKVINICKAYINDKLEIEEFKSRLEMIMLPDDYKNTLEIDRHNAINKIEKIMHSYLPENQKKYANAVAEELIHAAKIYLNR